MPASQERSQEPSVPDAISRSKRILALVDDYHDKPTNDTRAALRHALLEEFTEAPEAPITSAEPKLAWPQAKRVGRREDMSPAGKLEVMLDNDNDVVVIVTTGTTAHNFKSATVEFCNGGGGGGGSPKTRAALISLMTAIEADNAERPHQINPQVDTDNEKSDSPSVSPGSGS